METSENRFLAVAARIVWTPSKTRPKSGVGVVPARVWGCQLGTAALRRTHDEVGAGTRPVKKALGNTDNTDAE